MVTFEKRQPIETPCCVHILLPNASLVLVVFCYKYTILGACIQKLELQMVSDKNTTVFIIYFSYFAHELYTNCLMNEFNM